MGALQGNGGGMAPNVSEKKKKKKKMMDNKLSQPADVDACQEQQAHPKVSVEIGNGDTPNGIQFTKKQKRRKIDDTVATEATEPPKGLEIYWKLPSVDPNDRQAAAVALAKELQAAQQVYEARGRKVEDGAEKILLGDHNKDSLQACAPEVQYALPRLVRGVGSSNQCARQGFGLALATVIATVPCVTGESLLTLIQKEIEVSSSMKGQDLKDGLLGRLFAYAAIVRSDRLLGEGVTNEQKELAKNITDQLLSLARKKSFLREAAMFVFLELLDRLPATSLEASVFLMPIFDDWLKGSPEVGGADVLLLALRLWRKLPESLCMSCSLLPNTGAERDLFQASHLEVLIPYLKESSSSHPRLHPIWNVLAEMFSDRRLFSTVRKKGKRKNDSEQSQSEGVMKHCLMTFWTSVVDETFLVTSHERKCLAMQLVLLFLSKLPTSCIPIVLSNTFGRCLLDILSAKGNLLYNSAQQLLSDLCIWAEQDQDRLIPVIAFLQQSSCGRFDHITKTTTVKNLMTKVRSEASCLSAIQNLRDLFLNDPDDIEDDSEDAKKSLTTKKIWMVDLMCSLCKQVSLASASWSAAKEVLKFLAAHVLLDVATVNHDKLKELLGWAPMPISEAVKGACSTRFRAVLAESLSVTSHSRKPSIEGGKPDQEVGDLGYYLVELVQPALELDDDEDVQAKLQSAISNITSAMLQKEQAENVNKLKAMRCLLSQLLIQSWLEPGSMDEIALELIICCKKAFGKVVDINLGDEADDTDDTPSMADVILDVILALLSHSSAPIRNAAEKLFGLFCNDITPSGLSSMLKVIAKQMGNSRLKPIFEVQDDDEEDLLSIEDVEDDRDEMGEEDGNRSESEEEDDNQQADDQDKIEGALDDVEHSDLDDDAMFRIDAHLAQIMKQRKQGGVDAQTQLLHFKFRVLGLLQSFLQKQSASPSVFIALPSLFQTYLTACSGDGKKQLAERISSLLNKVLKAKHYPKGSNVDRAVVKDLLQKLLKLASRTTDKKTRTLAQGFVFWLFKVSQANSVAENEEVSEVMSTAVDDMFNNKKSRLPTSFLMEGLVRYPWLGRILIGKLVEKCRSARSDYDKAEAMNLISFVLKPYTKSNTHSSGSTLEKFASALRPHLRLLGEVLVLYFGEPLKKAAWQVSFVRFSVACVEALLVLFPGRPLNKLIDTEALSSALASFRPTETVKMKTFTGKLESLLQTVSDSKSLAEENTSPKTVKIKKRKHKDAD